jgi:hypothetical protein
MTTPDSIASDGVRIPKRDILNTVLVSRYGVFFLKRTDVTGKRQEAVNLASIVENEAGEQEDTEDDDGARDEREIWEVAHVTEEDFETNEGEVEDLCDKLMEVAGWKVTDNENENDLT